MSRTPNRNRGTWGGPGGRGLNERAKQLGDQEKWLEEKKREAEAKLAAREEEKAAEKRAAMALQSGAQGGRKTALGKFSAARFGLKGKNGSGADMIATCAEKKDVVKTEPKPCDGLFINDGNFLAKFYQMQGKEPPPTTTTVSETSATTSTTIKQEVKVKIEPTTQTTMPSLLGKPPVPEMKGKRDVRSLKVYDLGRFRVLL